MMMTIAEAMLNGAILLAGAAIGIIVVMFIGLVWKEYKRLKREQRRGRD